LSPSVQEVKAMTKSLSLVLLCLGFSEASRISTAPAEGLPLAGSQMIQIKANTDDAMKVKTTWKTTYTDVSKTCSNVGKTNVLTWNAKVDTAEACQQACESWGQVHVNQNSNRPCGAGYFYHKADGTPYCRLFETCETCVSTAIAGTTFTSSDESCSASCQSADCSKEDGFNPKPGFKEVTCASSVCTHEECCDALPGGDEPAEPEPQYYIWQYGVCINGDIRVDSLETCKAGVKIDNSKWPDTPRKFNTHSNRQTPMCLWDWPSAGCFSWNDDLYFSNCDGSRYGSYDARPVCQRTAQGSLSL